ncbi:MAG: alpha/beta hydrolase, partial [Chitinophagaceae bacterium]|nr:alpha/beta hydrolase [Chitinophagaceae bacterium]
MKRVIGLLWYVLTPFLIAAQTFSKDSTDHTIVVKEGKLSGTLFAPRQTKKGPVVLIIAGSGPTDRNGNSTQLPGKNNSLLQLADSLVKSGIASLRYDKRGIGKSQFPGMREETMSFMDGVNDVVAWINWLREQGYKKIYIAGHSEGSLVGMLAASQTKVKGFISIAGAGRPIDQVLREQIASGGGPDSLKQLANVYLDTLLQGKRIQKPNPYLFSLFRPSVQPYMISWVKHDPATLLKNLKCKVMIVQGKRDIQVKVEDAELLHNARPSATLLFIDDMNHVLKSVSTTSKTDNIKTYSDPTI